MADNLAELRHVPIDRIDTPHRPARRFLGDIAALAESMQEFGLQQPISVRVDGERFVLTSGLRRLAAARLLRWQTIPSFVRNVSADDAYVLDLIENLQREDLSPEEEAAALAELIRTRGWTLQQVANTIKRSLGYVSKRVRLFEDAALRDAVSKHGMPISTAEELLGAPAEHRGRLIERALRERWDQIAARDALRMDEPARAEVASAAAPVAPASATRDGHRVGEAGALTAPRPGLDAALLVRPRGLTRAIREFHRLIGDVKATDLTPSDRAALRALFRDLLLLARSSTTPAPPVFPPLPTVAAAARSSSRSRRQAAVSPARSQRSKPSRQ